MVLDPSAADTSTSLPNRNTPHPLTRLNDSSGRKERPIQIADLQLVIDRLHARSPRGGTSRAHAAAPGCHPAGFSEPAPPTITSRLPADFAPAIAAPPKAAISATGSPPLRGEIAETMTSAPLADSQSPRHRCRRPWPPSHPCLPRPSRGCASPQSPRDRARQPPPPHASQPCRCRPEPEFFIFRLHPY